MPINKRLDFNLVKERSLIAIDQVLNRWLPQGKRSGDEWVSINPTRSDSKLGSFLVNLTSGLWADFASDDKGGDLISLVAYLESCSQRQACNDLADFLGLDASKPDQNKPATKAKPRTEWTPIVPIPESAPKPPEQHYKHGKYLSSWRYLSKSGELLCIICRFDKPDGRKEILPLTYCESNGQKTWRWKGLPNPRPLYNLNQLHKRKTATVLVTEGEKAAKAASQLFPDCVVTTCLNGSMAPAKTDWSPLENRRVVLWPDNDDAGRLCMQKISGLFKAKKIALLIPDFFLKLPNGEGRKALPEKWDAADALIDGYMAEGLKDLFKDPKNLQTIEQNNLNQASKTKQSQKAQQKNTAQQSTPVRYKIVEHDKDLLAGVYYYGHDKTGQPMPPLFICDPLHISARTRDNNQSGWGYLLEWQDKDLKPHSWSMPSQMTSGSGEEYRKILLDGGLSIAPGQAARNHLTSYILSSTTTHKAHCTDSCGWNEKAYVLPDNTIYLKDNLEHDKVIFQSASGQVNTFKQRSTLDDWKKNVSTYCVGNSRLIFAVSAAFAGMMIGLIDDDSAGLHYRGDSSTGKTTALRVAASVFGGREYMQRWRSTDNALESLASQHCDATLILDELAQIDPKAAGDVAYMLANGSGKGRSNRNGTARARTTWRLLYLSAGEIGLAEHMAQAGKKVRAGQEVRLLDIPVDTGSGMGMFENIHDAASPAAFSRLLNQNATEHFGEPALAFIAKVQEYFDDIPDLVKQARKVFSEQHVPEDASGQVHRAALQFALVGCAGEIATKFDITGWKAKEAMNAATTCFEAWVNARGGTGNQEELAMLNQFDQFFELHGESRFTDWERVNDNHAPRTINRAGFRKPASDNGELTFYVFPQVFRSEICEGFDQKAMIKALIKEGYIETSGSGSPTRSVRLPGLGVRKCYVIQPVTTEADEKTKEIEQA